MSKLASTFSDKHAQRGVHHVPMSYPDPRSILAANMRRIIGASQPPGAKLNVSAWANQKDLDVKLIERMTKASHAVTIDTLQKVAEACGLQPWQLLVEDMNPADPGMAPISESERALLKRLRGLLGD